ncbi:enoyl-CoA hydratase-related protein [Sphingobium sp. EM0848]|uniref:enoyl-CoA hydratase-related protein n=1 Tax=Sphingobium sp. EM0848 TaxID=2743473 RepID=UPI00159CBDB2|nr:enoyl-CoA hydratase-related protein [Sphingobium sp. EM0848]
MEYELIEVEYQGAVGILRLNQPDKLNAMSEAMAEEIAKAVDQIETSARVMVVTGAGRAFCSGADLGEIPEDFGLVLETHINPLMTRLRNLSIPWISAVRGAAAGVGCSLALAADMILASETACFLQAFSKVGLCPDGGSSHLLARTIGRPRAMEMMLLGDRLPAGTALEWGLINRVAADDALESEALALAERLAHGPRSLSLIRAMAWHAVDADWQSALGRERRDQKTAGNSADCAEGIAAFLEKRKAVFTGA